MTRRDGTGTVPYDGVQLVQASSHHSLPLHVLSRGRDDNRLLTDVTHRLNNVLYSQDVAPRMGFVIPLTLQIMVVD